MFCLSCLPYSLAPAERFEERQYDWACRSLELFRGLENEWGVYSSASIVKERARRLGLPDTSLGIVLVRPVARESVSALQALVAQMDAIDVSRHPEEHSRSWAKVIEICANDQRVWDVSLHLWNVVRAKNRQGDIRTAQLLGALATIDQSIGVRQDAAGETARSQVLEAIGARCGKTLAARRFEMGRSMSLADAGRMAAALLNDETSKLLASN